ncbi:S26 family signal peptidase [Micromonospora globbae]|uniref:S26 family signal peptidase n=1 Tax=Micromonospora globbae TaxID=1894969 RepID=A0ABZ1SCM2_9ACTN|nr:S26 family signal peptidase [Micromonospora globbae]
MTVLAVVCVVVGVLAAALAAAGWWARRHLVVVTVRGSSMQPTFQHGDRVLVRRAPITAVRSGQVVVVAAGRPVGPRPPDDPLWMIKRLRAVPGDPVPRGEVPALASVPEQTVPAGRLVALGDNPEGSDSRQLGYFHAANLLGVVTLRLARAPLGGG